MIQECLPQVDIVLELLDARTPIASRNPELRKLIAQMKDMEAQMKGMLGQMNDTYENAPESASASKLGSCSECVNPCKDEIDPSEVGLCERFKAKI